MCLAVIGLGCFDGGDTVIPTTDFLPVVLSIIIIYIYICISICISVSVSIMSIGCMCMGVVSGCADGRSVPVLQVVG